jgi:acetyl esterase/lipase
VALDPDAQALADALAQLMPVPLHQMGVAGARAFLDQLDKQAPPPPPVHAVADRRIPGPAGPIQVRVYRPSDDPGLPVLLYLHGGGWTVGTLDGVDPLCRALCTAAGCLVVSVDYRLAPEHPFPAAVEDVYAAEAPLLTVDDVVWFWGQYLPDPADRADPRATPHSAANLAGLPPALVLTAEYDPIRDDGEAYAAALAEAGVEVTHTRYPGVFHGFFTMVGMLARTEQAVQDAAGQLRGHLS